MSAFGTGYLLAKVEGWGYIAQFISATRWESFPFCSCFHFTYMFRHPTSCFFNCLYGQRDSAGLNLVKLMPAPVSERDIRAFNLHRPAKSIRRRAVYFIGSVLGCKLKSCTRSIPMPSRAKLNTYPAYQIPTPSPMPLYRSPELTFTAGASQRAEVIF